mmetsp:Transcript_64068/g.134703  ORF Transcript_64068/g.134703 Transcript_64068/m.134703 type:complete len:263 (+) Transcript_64068:237-1025(+)
MLADARLQQTAGLPGKTVLGSTLDDQGLLSSSDSGKASLATDTAVVHTSCDLDVAIVAPIGGPAVADGVVGDTVLLTEASQSHSVVNLVLVLLTRIDLKDAAVVEEHLVRDLDANRDRTILQKCSQKTLFILILDVGPAHDLGSDIHRLDVLTKAIDRKVRAVALSSRHDSAVLADDLEGSGVRVAAIAAGIGRQGVVGLSPSAIQDELLGQLGQLTSLDGLDGFDGLRETISPAGPAHRLVLDGADDARPGDSPVEVLHLE